MTEDEALSKLRAIKARQENPNRRGDWEEDHEEADQVLVSLLNSLGFSEIVLIFQSISKWYA